MQTVACVVRFVLPLRLFPPKTELHRRWLTSRKNVVVCRVKLHMVHLLREIYDKHF
jgi:hypothetical protein